MKKNEVLTVSYELLSSILDSTPFGIMAIDLDGHIALINPQALVHLKIDYNVNELKEKDITEVIDGLDNLKSHIRKCLSGKRKDFDLEGNLHNGKYLTIRGRIIPDGMIITIADVTNIKKSEFNSLNSLLEGQEQERKRLAREIHDGIGPILSTVKMNLATIESDIESLNPDLGEKFKKSYEMIDEAANDLRAISHNLMPKILSDFGLIEALETLCEQIDRTNGVKVNFIDSGLEDRLDEVTELALYRIAQELINNTLRHAQAKKITIQLIRKDDYIQLMYEDDGKGFDVDMLSKGIGFMNIENRVKALVGTVLVDSQPGKGMTSTIEIPY